MRRCGHPPGHVWVRPGVAFVPRRYAGCNFDGQRRCHKCRAVLSYGPANDDDERVRVEIRAAELAQDIERVGYTVLSRHSDEIRGWSLAEANMQEPTGAWLAGYLARVIACHEEERRDP